MPCKAVIYPIGRRSFTRSSAIRSAEQPVRSKKWSAPMSSTAFRPLCKKNLLFEASGLREAEFASRIGVSGSELSAYLAGSTIPSVAMLVRMRRVARRFGRTRPRG
ncbi:Uncharacterised protein [Mycobacteroides abscessus subsp. abscessus]|nr:Uncharacterised protein [Mycobacteroides abscessus subsp. abscessus]